MKKYVSQLGAMSCDRAEISKSRKFGINTLVIAFSLVLAFGIQFTQVYAQNNAGSRITLSASLERPRLVELTWVIEKPSTIQSIRLHRATGHGAFQLFGTFQLLRSFGPRRERFQDNTVLAGVPYRYYVEAVSTTNVSLASNTVEINPLPVPTSGIFVSPTGTATNTGTVNSPLDLATALSINSPARPGTTIWLRSGLYTQPGAPLFGTEEPVFRAYLSGQPGSPITIRSYPGEWAVINGGIRVNGNDLTFRDYEVTNTTVSREVMRTTGMTVFGKRVKLINLVIHDVGNGIANWQLAEEAEMYGNILYRNGWEGPTDERGNGHGIYTQNNLGTKRVIDNISFENYSTGMKAYGQEGGVKGFHFEGNINFNNGAPARVNPSYNRIDNLLVGGNTPSERITIQNNYLYHPLTANGFNLRLGYRADANDDAVLKDNYIAGGIRQPVCQITRWNRLTVTGNTFISDTDVITMFTPRGVAASSYQWDRNSYFARNSAYPFSHAEYVTGAGYSFTTWRAATGLDQNSQWLEGRNGKPTGTHVFVRPNQYETGRAHLAVFNWDLQPAITLSAAQLTGILRTGDHFIIQNAQSLKGEPVASGVYDGVSIQLPLRGGTLGLEFNAFVLLKTGRQTPPLAKADVTAQRTVVDAFTTTSTLELADDSGFNLDEEELRIIQQLNEWRLARQLSPLEVNRSLCQASEWSAQDMAQREQADATDSLGRNAAQRARDFGFPGTLASVDESEWVYVADTSDPAALEKLFHQGLSTMSAWKSIGVARVFNAATGRWYWSVLFGAC